MHPDSSSALPESCNHPHPSTGDRLTLLALPVLASRAVSGDNPQSHAAVSQSRQAVSETH